MTRAAIGIDIGGTKIAAGIVNLETGAVSHPETRPTAPERGGEAVLEDCRELVEELGAWGTQHEPDFDVAGIGIGVPELVDRAGRVRSAFQFDWMHLALPRELAGLGPVAIASDVRAAALAEATFGAAQGAESALYLSVGTGISSCLLLDGQPYVGAHGNALVMGTGPTVVIDPATGNSVSHVLEEVASGPALARRYRLAARREVSGAEEVLDLASGGDLRAIAVVSSAALALGNAIGHLVNVLDPEIVIIGGGLGLAGGRFRDATERAMRTTIWSDDSRHMPLVSSRLGTEAGLIGAALSMVSTPGSEHHHLLEGAMR